MTHTPLLGITPPVDAGAPDAPVSGTVPKHPQYAPEPELKSQTHLPPNIQEIYAISCIYRMPLSLHCQDVEDGNLEIVGIWNPGSLQIHLVTSLGWCAAFQLFLRYVHNGSRPTRAVHVLAYPYAI